MKEVEYMARETMKTKIERLEKENAQLKEITENQDNELRKLKDELERLKKKRKKLAKTDNLELVAQQLENAQNSSDRWHREYFNQYEKNKRLEEEIQKLKSKRSRNKIIIENEEYKKHNERGAGRKTRFSAEQMETIKMCRLQGKKIKEIAELFRCSVG